VTKRVDGWQVETDRSTHAGRVVILTSPAYGSADLAREVDGELSRLCSEVPYASSGTIALAFPRAAVAHPLNGSGFVVPRVERTGIMAASWLSSKWPNRAPDDQVLMRAFVGGARDPDALDKSDDQLVAVAMAALRPLLGIRGEPVFTRVYRFDRKSAQHEVGHLARMSAIERRLESTPGLFVTGSGFRGVGIPDCVADARATARKAAEWIGHSRG
jgi:protoporphyrinogen/coproporphyrinogen III oxidase